MLVTTIILILIAESLTEGKEFYFAIPLIATDKIPTISVTTKEPTSGYLEIPYLNVNTSFNVDPSIPFTYDIPNNLKADTGIENKGIFVKAEQDISIQLKIAYGFNGDTVRVLKVLNNSREFMVAAFPSSSIGSDYKDNVLSIIATEDDTSVQIIEFSGESSQTVLNHEHLQRCSNNFCNFVLFLKSKVAMENLNGSFLANIPIKLIWDFSFKLSICDKR